MIKFFIGSSIVALYIIVTIATALLVRRFCRISKEAFRKMLHFIFLGAYIPLLLVFDVFWHAAILASLLLALVYPFVLILNRVPGLSVLLVERRRGEYLWSMILALFTMVISVILCWGVMGKRYLVLACIYAWGIGDGLAALVGKKYGKRKIKWRLADSSKSVEGSVAMFVGSFLSVFSTLIIGGDLSPLLCLAIAALTAAGCTLTEMCAKNGLDTVICPVTAMVIILPLVGLLGG